MGEKISLTKEQQVFFLCMKKLKALEEETNISEINKIRYFREQISKYLRNNKIHMTQYDANNARKISAAIAEYNQKGIQYTLDMLSTKTGLTQKVIRSTIQFSANAKQANVEEAY